MAVRAQHVGVGHVVVVGHRQTQIAIRELLPPVVSAAPRPAGRDAASRLTQCRRINTGRRQHRRGVHAKARQVARNDPEVTSEDSLFGHRITPVSASPRDTKDIAFIRDRDDAAVGQHRTSRTRPLISGKIASSVTTVSPLSWRRRISSLISEPSSRSPCHSGNRSPR